MLIIGAGPNQLPAIRLAKERGYRVVVTDMNLEAKGFALADESGAVSTRDVEETIAFAQQSHVKQPLDGVMTMASESAVTVARVAEALDLPGVDPQGAWNATHKVVRQKLFHQHGVPAPQFSEASTAEEAVTEAEKMGWPVVVKPVDSAGSRGVRKVNEPGEMQAAVDDIRKHSKRPEMLIEEFLIGSEHSIEGLVVDGEVHWTGFADRNYEKKELYPPYFLEDGDTIPTTLAPEVLKQVFDVSTKAVRALGIDWGPAKGDIMISHRGPVVIEMAARLSGDYFCYETVPLHNGINIMEILMDMSLGLPVAPDAFVPKMNQAVALRYVWPKPGIVTAIRGLDQVRAMPGVFHFYFEPRWADIKVGDRIDPPTSMGERLGSVMTFAGTREEAVAIAEKAVTMIEIETT